MNIIGICFVSIIGVIAAVILKGYKPEIGLFIVIVLSLMFLSWMLEVFRQMQTQFGVITKELEENKSFYEILFKIMGITYICEFASGICKDAGYSAISSQIEIVGKMLVLLSGIPVLIAVIETIKNYNI
ncbi:MAG: hypothetical protein IKL49_07845 [Lachnospiraceae bacterium]|nr:hypothetical protein [Lachnospiraceae bacterium]